MFVQVVYHPPQLAPVGAELGAAAPREGSGGGPVMVDGVMVDVPALKSAAAEAALKLQDESGARAAAEVCIFATSPCAPLRQFDVLPRLQPVDAHDHGLSGPVVESASEFAIPVSSRNA